MLDPEERAAAFIAAARSYAGLGWVLLDLDGKEPRRRGWQKTSHDAPELAAGKWSQWGRTANMGVLLGASGLAVVEPDTPEAEAKLLELLGGVLPPVPIVKSGGKSLHLYFVDQGQGNASRDGLELRGGAQQCVLPPSVHPDTGRSYVWLEGHEPAHAPLAIPAVVLGYFGANGTKRKAAPVGDAIAKGERHRTLISLAGSMRHRALTGDEIAVALLAVNARRCRPPLPDEEVVELAHDVARRYQPAPPDPEQRRIDELARRLLAREEDTERDEREGSRAEDTHDEKRDARLELFLPFDQVVLTGPPRWLWRGKIPQGAVTLCAGRPKLGKSLLTIWLAAQLSRGLLEGSYHGAPARTLLVTAEDPPDTIVKPRLIAAAADESLVGTLAFKIAKTANIATQDPGDGLGGLDGLDGAGNYARRITIPDEYTLLERIVVESEIALVVLDPINSFITHKVDAHRDAEIRRVLDPLGAMAARRRFAVVAVVHLNRRNDSDVLNRILGSTGYGGSARSILTFARHPENEPQRVVASEGNWQKTTQSDVFELREVVVFADAAPAERTQPALVHIGTTDLDSADLIDQDDDRSALEEAKTFLLAELVLGPVAVSDLRRGADANGLSWRTVERAKKLLGVEARRFSAAGSPRGSGRWEWFLELLEQDDDEPGEAAS